MSNYDYLWHVLFFMYLNEGKEKKNMVKVVATIERECDGQMINVTKNNDTGYVILDNGDTVVAAKGEDIITAVLAVGGLVSGFPFGMPGVYPEKEGAK